jgi:hypothetical protein
VVSARDAGIRAGRNMLDGLRRPRRGAAGSEHDEGGGKTKGPHEGELQPRNFDKMARDEFVNVRPLSSTQTGEPHTAWARGLLQAKGPCGIAAGICGMHVAEALALPGAIERFHTHPGPALLDAMTDRH